MAGLKLKSILASKTSASVDMEWLPFINLWTLWFCSCMWKILNMVSCLCFPLLIF